MSNILTPVGRLVAGSVYKANDKDFQGNPLVTKTGANAGQPRIEFFFALAIQKGHERHWAETPWGAEIWQVGHAAFPRGEAQRPDFAWKIVDGDSQVPNRKNVMPCMKEGYPGHWVLSFSSGYPPKLYNANGTQQLVEPDAVKTGYYVQVAGTMDGNNNPQNPGIYLNHSMVALAGYGEVINTGPDPTQVGFGTSPLPQGASAVPMGGGFAPAPPVQQQYAPPVQQQYAPPVQQQYIPPTSAAPPAANYQANAPYVPSAPSAPGAPSAGGYLNPGPHR